MKIRRALLAGLFVYLSSFVTYILLQIFGLSTPAEIGWSTFFFGWVINIPVVLLATKWYFKVHASTWKKGFLLGLIMIGIALLLDGLFILLALMADQSLDQFIQLYQHPGFYITVAEIIFLCMYAGFEFDKTYTNREQKNS